MIDNETFKEHYDAVVEKYRTKDFFESCVAISMIQVLHHQGRITEEEYLEGYKMILEDKQ